ncbi:hypothetical protein D6C93_01639 [Aureobasidium pullulans]|nr:hypothetical protein D6C93_01639 [Aureobasidium pullulans]
MLSWIISTNEYYPDHPGGKAVLVNDKYELVNTTLPLFDTPEFNIHEYNIINDGASVLTLYSNPVSVNETWIQDDGIAEIDLSTGAILFRWSSLEHIPLNASNFHLPKAGTTSHKRPWDWFHANSIDKNADGDYLLSSRHTSCIYKVSGSDGSLIWQLGGKTSDFDHSGGFNFSWQHDARYRFEDKTVTTISFFDNAGIGMTAEDKTTGNWSRAVVVELNTSASPMTTRVLHSYDRLDHETSIARGSMQMLPNDNVFIGWASYGLISEVTQDGTPVMEARFVDETMSTYRSYKFNFTGRPQSPPVTRSIVYGNSPKTANTFHYCSWNGATDVNSWNLYGSSKNSSDSFTLLANVEKTEFETMYMTRGFVAYLYVEAIGADGKVMSRSIPTASELPRTWIGTFCTADGICEIDEHDESLQKPEHEHFGAKLDHGIEGISLTKDTLDEPMMLGVGLLVIIACVYLMVHLYRRRNVVRYKHVE